MKNPKKKQQKGKPSQSSERRAHTTSVVQAPEVSGYPFPAEASRIIAASRNDNFGLHFHRLLRYPQEWQLEGEKKGEAWKEVVQRARSIYQQLESASAPLLLQSMRDRLQGLEAAYSSQRFRTFSRLEASVVWRLTIGLGTASTLDTGLTLHRVYGIPYIPGSAVKGLTRSYYLSMVAESLGVPRLRPEWIKVWEKEKLGKTPWEHLECLLMTYQDQRHPDRALEKVRKRRELLERSLTNELLHQWNIATDIARFRQIDLADLNRMYVSPFSRIFGSTDAQGEVIFFDAYPTSLLVNGQPILELDIMNPHYGPYYINGEPPADWHAPRPVNFLTVRKGTKFEFTLASKDEGLLQQAKCLLSCAIQELGVGAKTRAGYGELSNPSARSAAGKQGGTATAAIDPSVQLEASIAHWKHSEMGVLPQLIEKIVSIEDVEHRRRLAQQLQQKLKEAGKWTRNYKANLWYQTLEQLLGGAPNEPK